MKLFQKIVLTALIITVTILVASVLVVVHQNRGIPTWWSWYVVVYQVLLYILAVTWLYQSLKKRGWRGFSFFKRREHDTFCNTQ